MQSSDRKIDLDSVASVHRPVFGKESGGISEAAKEVLTSMREYFRAEGRLISAEAKSSVQEIRRHLIWGGLSVALMLGGGLSFVVFLILAIGRLLGDNYTLSSLLVGVLLVGIGGLLLRSHFKPRGKDFPGPDSDHSLNTIQNITADNRERGGRT